MRRIVVPLTLMVAGAVSVFIGHPASGQSASPRTGSAVPGPSAEAPDTLRGTPYYRIPLRRPGDPRGRAFGHATVAFPDSPFTVAVTPEGYYLYDVRVFADRLPPSRGMVRVLWVASPDLETLRKVGVIERGRVLETRIGFDNKFLVFITEESSGEVTSPTGRIILRGGSRSGRMESMFSHGFCPPDTQC